MTVTILKGKTKVASNQVDAVVQRYVASKLALDAKLAKLAKLQKEVEASEKELLEYTDMLVSPSEGTELQAGEYVVKIGPKGLKATEFDKDQIKQALGAKTFFDLAQFSVTDLKKYLTGEQFAGAVKYENVTKRRVIIEEAKQNA